MSKTAINQKRQQFHSQIRKKQKQSFFLQERMKILQALRCTSQIADPIPLLKTKTNLAEVFEQICRRINGSNSYSDTMKMMQKGLAFILMNFLREKIYLKESLEVISYLLVKQRLNFYTRFYQSGLLQYLFMFIQVPELAPHCTYMIERYSEQGSDYIDVMLHNNSHKILIEEFINRANKSKDIELENKGSGDKFYSYIISTLENFLCVKESTFDFEQQKKEITSFAIFLLERRILLKESLCIVFEAIKRDKNCFNDYLHLFNQLMAEANLDSNYLYNLFASIYLLAPVDIDFNLFFKLGGMVKAIEKPVIRIVQKMAAAGGRYAAAIPTDELWWQRLLINPVNFQNHTTMLSVIDELNINKEWVWRVLGTALDQSNSHTIHQQCLRIINRKIRDRDRKDNILFYLHKHHITKQLDKLANISKNSHIKERCSHLLDEILGPLTEESEMSSEVL